MAIDMTAKPAPRNVPFLMLHIEASASGDPQDCKGTGHNIRVDVPVGLSLRVAKLHAIEQIMKQMRTAGLGEVLKAMGFK